VVDAGAREGHLVTRSWACECPQVYSSKRQCGTLEPGVWAVAKVDSLYIAKWLRKN
jgi:hypothetical protein